jgi:hypothetical protein
MWKDMKKSLNYEIGMHNTEAVKNQFNLKYKNYNDKKAANHSFNAMKKRME